MAAALVASIAAGAWFYAEREAYSTGIGERRLIALDDGSSIELNARSRLKVRFTRAARTIELERGEALFRVAKDPTRPFIVATGTTNVRAVGTQFDVYRKPARTIVTVIEGRVIVAPAKAPSNGAAPAIAKEPATAHRQPVLRELSLGPGEQATATVTAIERPERLDASAATAWLENRLVFSGTPLADVADEFNRYNTRQLVIDNPSGVPFEVSGAFSMTDLPSLLRFLRAQPKVQIDEGRAEIVVRLK